MTLCVIQDHVDIDKINTYYRPKDMLECTNQLDVPNSIIDAVISNGWAEEGDTWGSLDVDQYAYILSKAFTYKDSVKDDPTESEHMVSIIVMVTGFLAASFTRSTGVTVDQLTVVRAVDDQVAIHMTISEMYHFAKKPNDTTPVLKIVK